MVKNKQVRSKWQSLALNLGLLGALIFFLFPIFWILLLSFRLPADILTWPPKLFTTLTMENYRALFYGGGASGTHGSIQVDFLGGILHSSIINIGALIVSLIVGLPAAYALARYKFTAKENIAFTLLSFRFAPAIMIIIPLFVIFQKMGLYDTYTGLIWAYQLITLPMIVWLVRGYFEDVPPEIEQAYRLDGYPGWKSFFKVTLPLARPGIIAASILAFIYGWNNFLFGMILSSSIQPVTVVNLKLITPGAVYFGQVAAGAILAVIPTLILAIYTNQYIVQGLTMGAVKK
jgi:multiple sugar transport system permease protein